MKVNAFYISTQLAIVLLNTIMKILQHAFKSLKIPLKQFKYPEIRVEFRNKTISLLFISNRYQEGSSNDIVHSLPVALVGIFLGKYI